MIDDPIVKLSICYPNPEGATLHKIAESPRTAKPAEVEAAAGNLSVSGAIDSQSRFLQDIAGYFLADFFALAHRTGLYNRQNVLWDALSKINSIDAFQLRHGIFTKKALPAYFMHFLDFRQRTLIVVACVEPKHEDKLADIVFDELIRRVKKIPGIIGTAVFCPAESSAAYLERVQKEIINHDPVARYESLLKAPFNIPLDLFAYSFDGEALPASNLSESIILIQPDLTRSGKRAITTSLEV